MNGTETYYIQTFGCQMNERDSETLAGMLEQMGYRAAASREAADVVVLNTCSVREHADERFFGTLGQLKKRRLSDPGMTVCLCGCMMQQPRIVERVRSRFPWVDLVFGTHNLHRFPVLLQETLAARRAASAADGEAPASSRNVTAADGAAPAVCRNASAARPGRAAEREPLVEVWEENGEPVEQLPSRRRYRHKAFVNIMQGCNNFCTYCIVPYTRGRERSRTPAAILEEVRALAADGVREVTLLGQNVNSYRGEGGVDFAALVHRIDAVDGIERIRFMTSHPKDLSDDLIAAFGSSRALCGHIHLPVQAGSDRVLRRMNRRYTAAAYLDLVRRLRAVRPQITLTTDLIVGFPGESEEDFQATLDLCETVRFDSAFTFLYSPRPGTPAAEYAEQVPEEVKHERFGRLVETVNRCAAEHNARCVGRTLEVLVDGPAERGVLMQSGRSDGFKLVNFHSTEELTGRIVPVRITEGRTFSLYGEVLRDMCRDGAKNEGGPGFGAHSKNG